jgi:Putative secretion activating protein
VTDEQIIESVLAREGGYVNDPADEGGPTNYGITAKTLADWRGRPVTTKDVIALTQVEARAIYMDRYVVKPGLHRVDGVDLRASLVDAAVQHGPTQAVRSLQRALGVKEDGEIGEETLAAIKDLGEHGVMAKFAAERVRLYGRIISSKPDQAKFASGWLNRVADFIEALA